MDTASSRTIAMGLLLALVALLLGAATLLLAGRRRRSERVRAGVSRCEWRALDIDA